LLDLDSGAERARGKARERQCRSDSESWLGYTWLGHIWFGDDAGDNAAANRVRESPDGAAESDTGFHFAEWHAEHDLAVEFHVEPERPAVDRNAGNFAERIPVRNLARRGKRDIDRLDAEFVRFVSVLFKSVWIEFV